MNKLDKSLSRGQISSAINALVARGNISEEFGRVAGKDLTIDSFVKAMESLKSYELLLVIFFFLIN